MQWLLLLLCRGVALAAATPAITRGSSWARGSFGHLAVDPDGSMTFQFGAVSLLAPAPNGNSGTKPGVAGTGSTRKLIAPFKAPLCSRNVRNF
jgi:hypothetical protein